MFVHCWANVVDGGPTLVKHWVDVSCFLGLLHIAISVLQGSHLHLSQVKYVKVKCLAQGHSTKINSQH